MNGSAQTGADSNADGALTWLQRLRIRLLHVYFRLSRGMTLGVRAAVLNDRGEVFLVRHTYTPGWHLPGGGVEVGETMAAALAKELREEARISLTGPATLFGLYFNRKTSRRDHVALYVVRDFVVDAAKMPDLEIAEARFFPLDALPQGLTPGTRRRLAEIAGGIAPAAEW
ncbi:MAG: NUDIX domain-containing protein [Bosea sp. (in: a-proteobacteria)]|uniref:NUDIX domain-containing protein n=1 Tax=Bosea sp. (in: a-proteobacteria) TaxID=1871050 RepID=UPI0027333C5B|nr:NUDIX domain-containing protein [Bosea sp. (in: a-proteobacteria)]MDP3257685.1 NUDIX domain-containing protein [Bosea sp. (in: a-proteobacteria)]MDP3319062.1 NUDIX domain-containing protein [Bosea sp. (in: a-proteobacteria)]